MTQQINHDPEPFPIGGPAWTAWNARVMQRVWARPEMQTSKPYREEPKEPRAKRSPIDPYTAHCRAEGAQWRFV